MIKLDDNLLQQLGLGTLPPEEKKKMLAHIYETLEMRVGMELAKKMTDAQLSEFEQFINRNDEAGALRWLESNFPNYKDVVAAEFEKLKTEIAQAAPQIIAAGQQQQAQMPAQQYPQQPYPQEQYGSMPPQQPYPPQPQAYPGQQPQMYQPQMPPAGQQYPQQQTPGQPYPPYQGQPQMPPQGPQQQPPAGYQNAA
jgi:hypothetical protein